jgi:hypothetical protein
VAPDNSFKVQELTADITDAKMMARLFFGGRYNGKPRHVVLCVTLADGVTWAIDPAGAQYGQYKPVLRLSDYDRDYVANFPSCSAPHGSIASDTKSARSFSLPLMDIENYQIDQLHEWVFENVPIKHLLKVKTKEFVELKQSLVAHLAAAACDHVNLANGDSTSPAKITLLQHKSNPGLLSEHDRGRVERKKARMIADMGSQHPGLAPDSDIWSHVTFA